MTFQNWPVSVVHFVHESSLLVAVSCMYVCYANNYKKRVDTYMYNTPYLIVTWLLVIHVSSPPFSTLSTPGPPKNWHPFPLAHAEQGKLYLQLSPLEGAGRPRTSGLSQWLCGAACCQGNQCRSQLVFTGAGRGEQSVMYSALFCDTYIWWQCLYLTTILCTVQCTTV